MIIVSEPVGSELKSIVLRLGGFHTEMSFLGCIGHLMAASGLQELLEQVYAPNAVVHMLNGKATARALRGHLIVDAALNAVLLSQVTILVSIFCSLLYPVVIVTQRFYTSLDFALFLYSHYYSFVFKPSKGTAIIVNVYFRQFLYVVYLIAF